MAGVLSAASKTSERAWVFFMGIDVEKWMGSLYDSQPARMFLCPVGARSCRGIFLQRWGGSKWWGVNGCGFAIQCFEKYRPKAGVEVGGD